MIKSFNHFIQEEMSGKPIVQSIYVNTLSSENNKKALDIVNLVTQKSDAEKSKIKLLSIAIDKK